jgi:MFS superfamily sulfate permease-like transporter
VTRLHLPLFEGLRPLSRDRSLRDAVAGLNLACINIAQVLGYARIAGMPVVTGLYTLLLPPVAFALFGSSRHLVVAADSATAAILASSLSLVATPGGAHYVSLVGALALLTAAMLLLARLFKLGFLADFLSRTVLSGFLAGVGAQVAIAMLGDMLGVAETSGNSLIRLGQVLSGLRSASTPTLALSAAAIAAILLGKRFLPRWPVPLAAIVAAIAASQAFHFAAHGIAVMGAVAGGLPAIHLPEVTWNDVLGLVPVAASCFVTIIAQSAATSRSFAMRYGERDDINADILGLAAANAAAAVSGTFLVNGSPTQTAVAEREGARSQMAQLVLSGTTLLVLLLASAEIEYLPHCVLAAVVFTIAIGMIDVRSLRDMRLESPGEFYLALATGATVIAIGVEQGILLAIALSLFRHVRHSYEPHTLMYKPDAGGRWLPGPVTPGAVTEPGLIVYRFGADLFYANQQRFCDEVHTLAGRAPAPLRYFVVDASAITDLDYSAARSVRALIEDLQSKGVRMIFGRVSAYLRADMDRHHITTVIGAQYVCATLHEALQLAGAQRPPSTA